MLFLWEHLNIVVFGNKWVWNESWTFPCSDLYFIIFGGCFEYVYNVLLLSIYSLIWKKKRLSAGRGEFKGHVLPCVTMDWWMPFHSESFILSYSVYWSRRVMRRLNFFCYHSPWGFMCKCGIRSDLQCQRWLRYIQGCVLCSRGLYLPTLCEQSLGLFFCEDTGYLWKNV